MGFWTVKVGYLVIFAVESVLQQNKEQQKYQRIGAEKWLN